MKAVDLVLREAEISSQGGEDGVIAELVRQIGAPGKFFVEFGAEAGQEANCLLLAERFGWSGLFMEGDPEKFQQLQAKYSRVPEVQTACEMVYAENLEDLLAKHSVPREPDLFSIDIDSNDWYVWKALQNYHPRILIIEYNGQIHPDLEVVIPQDNELVWEGNDYYGASISAMRRLGKEKGYELVHTNTWGVNAFFVREDLLPGTSLPTGDQVPLHAANYGRIGDSHPRDPHNRPWINLADNDNLVYLG